MKFLYGHIIYLHFCARRSVLIISNLSEILGKPPCHDETERGIAPICKV